MYRVVLHDFGLEFHQEFTGSLGSPSLNGVYVRPLECAIPALSIFLPEKTKKGKEKKEKSDEAAAKAAEKAVIKEAQKDKTDTLSLSTGKDSEAKLKISKVVVEATKGETVEEYVVDLAERKIFLGNKNLQNDFGVFDEVEKKKFKVELMSCGGVINEPCGFIKLPAWYQPGLECKWYIDVDDEAKEILYQVDVGDQVG